MPLTLLRRCINSERCLLGNSIFEQIAHVFWNFFWLKNQSNRQIKIYRLLLVIRIYSEYRISAYGLSLEMV